MALDLNTLKNNVNDIVAQINNLDIETIEVKDYLTSLEVNTSVYSKNETIEKIDADKVIINGSIYSNDFIMDSNSIKNKNNILLFDDSLIYNNKSVKAGDNLIMPSFTEYDIKKDLIPGEYYIVVTKNNIKKTYLINYRNSDFICDDFKIQKNKIITDFEIHVRIRGAKNDSTN